VPYLSSPGPPRPW